MGIGSGFRHAVFELSLHLVENKNGREGCRELVSVLMFSNFFFCVRLIWGFYGVAMFLKEDIESNKIRLLCGLVILDFALFCFSIGLE